MPFLSSHVQTQLTFLVEPLGQASSLLGIDLQYVGRAELCQPAVGVGQVDQVSLVTLWCWAG